MGKAITYDPDNIFAKILRKEIPNDTVLDGEFFLAFRDISPQAPVHILVIPKGPYRDIGEFSVEATPQELIGFWTGVRLVIEQEGLADKGYRVISNTGEHGGQEVPHFHLHILGGKPPKPGSIIAYED